MTDGPIDEQRSQCLEYRHWLFHFKDKDSTMSLLWAEPPAAPVVVKKTPVTPVKEKERMKNWRTTLFAVLALVCQALVQHAESEAVKAAPAALLAAGLAVAKDAKE